MAWGRYGGKGEVQTAFWCADLRESDHVKDTGVNRCADLGKRDHVEDTGVNRCADMRESDHVEDTGVNMCGDLRESDHVEDTGVNRCADLRESDHVEDTGVNMTVIVKWALNKSVGTAWLDRSGSEWGKWRALVNATMNLQVHCCNRFLD